MNIQQLFLLGMKRELPELLEPRGLLLELGPGNHPVPGTIGLEYPAWDAERHMIPYDRETVDGIFAFHFLEHFRGARVITILRDIERVLKPNGVLTTVIPYYTSQMAHHDLTHESFWTEETWRNLFSADYIKNRERPWHLAVHFNLIIGIVERNLSLMTQIVKLP